MSTVRFLAAACVGICMASSCNEAQRQQGLGSSRDLAKLVEISPLVPSNALVTEDLQIDISKVNDGLALVVTAKEEFPPASELFFRLDYGDAGLQAQDVVLLPGKPDQALSAAFPSGPTSLDVGMVLPVGATGNVCRPGDIVLSCKLVQSSAEGKQVSSALKTTTSPARNLELLIDADSQVLAWDYTNPGDTNQDGEVGIADLKEIGVNFKDTIESPWEDSNRHVDADNNGEINLGDISSIGGNYNAKVWGYNIQMAASQEGSFQTVGQMILEDERGNIPAGETVRFSYKFVGQYVAGAWYRVVPLVNNPDGGVLFGTPSESISETGRALTGIAVPKDETVTITVYAAKLTSPIAHCNAVRVVLPAGYEYVPNSFNSGAPGGSRDAVDGIWASFATALLIGPDHFVSPTILPDGSLTCDFNVTTVAKSLPNSPVGYGDLFNFQVRNVSGGELSVRFDPGLAGGVKRTYYSQEVGNEVFVDHYFGNCIGARVS